MMWFPGLSPFFVPEMASADIGIMWDNLLTTLKFFVEGLQSTHQSTRSATL
jgi:hypothetical protein